MQTHLLQEDSQIAVVYCMRGQTNISLHSYAIETVSPEGTFCDTVQVPSGASDMQLN